ncbi:hypothetical protein BJV77DRAFT_980390 [Russula vinacea]|nr:hypothetical protein BJV77DRAFT_980390 [Russula vinacea]
MAGASFSDVPHPNFLSPSACSDWQRAWEGPKGSLTTMLRNYLKNYHSPSYGALMTHINSRLHGNPLALHDYMRQERKRSHVGQEVRLEGELDNLKQPELSSLVRLVCCIMVYFVGSLIAVLSIVHRIWTISCIYDRLYSIRFPH